jgi:integrase
MAGHLSAPGVTDLEFRDLRHEAGARWLETGVPLHEVSYLLGHPDIQTTGI